MSKPKETEDHKDSHRQIEADRAGTVTAIHAENGEPVEFDQPLITIA